jgi:hypothetical protein
MLWLVDAYDLNLRELMQTVKTTYVLTVRTSLTTETLCISAVLDREILLIEDNVTVDVGYRNLCCWER